MDILLLIVLLTIVIGGSAYATYLKNTLKRR
jgi:hypothetical protein